MIDFSKIFNKEQRKTIVNAILTPFSWCYGAGVWLRNLMFTAGILKQHSFDVPVVSVGNITVGGTGKTPHVEYIIEHLCRKYKIGVLSRGYKRSTHGFILATSTLSPKDIGDEPYQIFHKFNGLITLAVCEDRCKGIREMLKINPDINLFVLDDAFQHRYVKPKVNIVLVDFNRPPFRDKLLPLGFLREPLSALLRADFVVVTKCPTDIKPVDIRMMKENLDLYPAQQLFFSNIRYANPLPVFPIDHHTFTREDFNYIAKFFNKLEGKQKFILTTEKDAVRILNNPYFPPELRNIIYYIPIRVGFLNYEDRDIITELIKKIEAGAGTDLYSDYE